VENKMCVTWHRNAYKIFVGKPEQKTPLQRCGWKDDIKMYIKETGCEDVDVIHCVRGKDQWRVIVNTIMSLLVSLRA
jgi:hypothetical protein